MELQKIKKYINLQSKHKEKQKEEEKQLKEERELLMEMKQ